VPHVYLLLHSNGNVRSSTVAGRLSMFTTCGRFPWKAPTQPWRTFLNPLMSTRPLFQDIVSHTLRLQGGISQTYLSQTELHILFCLRAEHHSPLGVGAILPVPYGPKGEPWWFSRYSDWLWSRWPRGQISSSGRAKVSFLFKSYRPVLGSIQLPSQWVQGASFLGEGVKRAWYWPLFFS
jgi:hypothetical protein